MLRQPQWATFCLLGLLFCLIAITLAWIENVGGVSHFFAQVNAFQTQAEDWFTIPTPDAGWLLSLGLLLVTWSITWVSPQPKLWSRFLVITILLVLIVRYVLWRSLTTLNLSTPLNGIVSLVLFAMEMLIMASYGLQLFLMLRERDRRREADAYATAVAAGSFMPTVDVLIPTYNEPAVVLRRTIVGCQAMDYPHKQVYLLDDGKRAEIRALAAELGCHYIARPSNRYAKAGNLNYAIARTKSTLITIFDADFVPTRNFLSRTVGFFQAQSVGLVQTHQAFYNADPPARNLGLAADLTHEVEIFSRHYQPVRDGADSVLCYGSSFVVRRQALEEVGCFVTNTLSEDYFTGVRISAHGYQVIYLDENLSAGLVPEDMPSHISQRQRWARGTLQAFFIKESPLVVPGLTPRQRIAHLEGICQWFSSVCRVGFLLVPIAATFWGIIPVASSIVEWTYFFLPLYLVQFASFAWLNHRSRSALISDVYSVIQCFPLSATVLHTLVSPFSKGFHVTPKGTVCSKTIFHWQLAMPLIVLWVLTLISFVWTVISLLFNLQPQADFQTTQYMQLGLFWSGYNLLVLGIAILSYADVPKLHTHEWFEQRHLVELGSGDRALQGVTTKVSEAGAEVLFNEAGFQWTQAPLRFGFPDEGLFLQAAIVRLRQSTEGVLVNLAFTEVSSEQHRRLIEMLFCNPGQWKRQPAPNEFRMLWLMVSRIFRPKSPVEQHLPELKLPPTCPQPLLSVK